MLPPSLFCNSHKRLSSFTPGMSVTLDKLLGVQGLAPSPPPSPHGTICLMRLSQVPLPPAPTPGCNQHPSEQLSTTTPRPCRIPHLTNNPGLLFGKVKAAQSRAQMIPQIRDLAVPSWPAQHLAAGAACQYVSESAHPSHSCGQREHTHCHGGKTKQNFPLLATENSFLLSRWDAPCGWMYSVPEC